MRDGCEYGEESIRIERSFLSLNLGPALVISILVLTILSSLLIWMRFRSLQLDGRSAILDKDILSMELRLSSSRKKVMALSSPSVIYGYACKKLGMKEGLFAGVIRFRDSNSGKVALYTGGRSISDSSSRIKSD